MSYIQLNEDGTFLREVYGDVQEWDEKNYCSVDSLVRDGKAEQFRVYPLVRTEQPAFDPITHGVRAATPVKVGNDWHQAWEVYPLPVEDVVANQAAAIQAAREQAKAQRQAAVDAIKVTTQAGNTFDGDEISQTRMTRAVLAMQATGTASVTWVLADNTVIQATVPELTEALALAGAEQARLWVIK